MPAHSRQRSAKRESSPLERLKFAQEFRCGKKREESSWIHPEKDPWQNSTAPEEYWHVLVKALESYGAEPSERFRRLEAQVFDLQKAISELQTVVLPKKGMVVLDDYDKWIVSKDAAQYAGLHVAFVAGKGVIASAPNSRELLAKIKGYSKRDEISVSLVP